LAATPQPSSPKPPIITIDGPAGAGKSTAAQGLAHRLGYLYLDTGAMYRAITLKVLREGIDPHDAPAVTEIARRSDIRLQQTSTGELRVKLDGEVVTALIRSARVNAAVSQVSAIEGVRSSLVALQRHLAAAGGVVAEGRDMGTVVFPHAAVKIYLTAGFQERVRRRWRQDSQRAVADTPEHVAANLRTRDALDSGRTISPLRPATDAVVLDNSNLSALETVEAIVRLVQEVTGVGASPERI